MPEAVSILQLTKIIILANKAYTKSILQTVSYTFPKFSSLHTTP